ncbi:MAG: coproporphyrinogen-III oxidase family protein [Desulfobacterales bacterium]|nr:coproporphyrinogen-III oxidase family protein [Desulfobacterales bacterium]
MSLIARALRNRNIFLPKAIIDRYLKSSQRHHTGESRSPEIFHSNQPAAGIYIHIPFCVRKCPYCDFYSIAGIACREAFVHALTQEMLLAPRAYADCPDILNADTLYLGGGTPSVLSEKDTAIIMDAAFGSFTLLPGAEITIEVNPGTIDERKLKGYRDLGFNRINIGAQSFDQANLKFLGRIHSRKDTVAALEWARQAGFDNIGLDLIYAIPGQTRKSWLRDLAQAVEFEPDHLPATCSPMNLARPWNRIGPQSAFSRYRKV